MNKPIRVLSFPSRHPYMSKFNDGVNIKFVNPDTDLFSQQVYDKELLDKRYPPESYDVVHIHFSFDKVSLENFKNFLEYFKSIKKPIVWTTHSLESLRLKGFGGGEYQKLLFDYSNALISPTEGCKKYLLKKYGPHKCEITVIPLGYMASPEDVERISENVTKNKDIFTILIGDFRENKEVIQSVINFLQCSVLNGCILQLIYKPINPYIEKFGELNEVMLTFFRLTQYPRVSNISLPFITNDRLTEAFLRSHAVILPYKWGTHSGQVELAKDCGCHVVVTDVGYYKEQWDKINVWKISDNKFEEFPARYTNCLIDVYQEKSLGPAGSSRHEELLDLIKKHIEVYKALIDDAQDLHQIGELNRLNKLFNMASLIMLDIQTAYLHFRLAEGRLLNIITGMILVGEASDSLSHAIYDLSSAGYTDKQLEDSKFQEEVDKKAEEYCKKYESDGLTKIYGYFEMSLREIYFSPKTGTLSRPNVLLQRAFMVVIAEIKQFRKQIYSSEYIESKARIPLLSDKDRETIKSFSKEVEDFVKLEGYLGLIQMYADFADKGMIKSDNLSEPKFLLAIKDMKKATRLGKRARRIAEADIEEVMQKYNY